MKGEDLEKLVNVIEWFLKWWKWLMLAVGVLIFFVVKTYLKDTRELRQTTKDVKRVNEQVQDLEAARINVRDALEKREMRGVIILEKQKNESIKIIRIPDHELQLWADSLYNATR